MASSRRKPAWLRTRKPTPREEGWRWPAEWERHEGTWIAWPHDPTTWGDALPEVEDAYTRFAWAVGRGETVHVLVRSRAMQTRVEARLAAAGVERFALHHAPTVDAWIRDYGPIVVVRGSRKERERLALDFTFNAWGGKYRDLMADDKVPARLVRRHGLTRRKVGLVLEGGSIEGNGKGTLLTSEQCLLNPNRNPDLCRAEIEANLRETLGVRHVLWLGDGNRRGRHGRSRGRRRALRGTADGRRRPGGGPEGREPRGAGGRPGDGSTPWPTRTADPWR